MVVVLFEVTLKENMQEAYLKMAENLRSELETQEGFISLERFTSIQTPGKMLSVQLWDDEKAIERWRNNESHRKIMRAGYYKIFDDYSLKVLNNIRSYGKYDRSQAPADVSFPSN